MASIVIKRDQGGVLESQRYSVQKKWLRSRPKGQFGTERALQ